MIMFFCFLFFYSNILDSGSIFFYCSFLYKISFPEFLKRKYGPEQMYVQPHLLELTIMFCQMFKNMEIKIQIWIQIQDIDVNMGIDIDILLTSLPLLSGYCFPFTFFITFLGKLHSTLSSFYLKGKQATQFWGFKASILPTGPLQSPTDLISKNFSQVQLCYSTLLTGYMRGLITFDKI